MGRTPQLVRYGPREIDIDLLLWGADLVSQPGLEVPHPQLAERAFVLAPLAELAPQMVHPAVGHTIQELLARMGGAAGVDWWGPPPEPAEA